jgi:hypothetical protein
MLCSMLSSPGCPDESREAEAGNYLIDQTGSGLEHPSRAWSADCCRLVRPVVWRGLGGNSLIG